MTDLSKCHQTSVRIESNARPGKTTVNNWYVCTECNEPCDLATAPSEPMDEVDRILVVYHFKCAAIGLNLVGLSESEPDEEFEKFNKQQKEADVEAKSAITALIERRCDEARIDELKEIAWSKASDKAKDELFNKYIKDRINELKAKQEGQK